MYNVDDYSTIQLQVFRDIHRNVRERLQATSEAMCLQQHKRTAPVSLKVGDSYASSPNETFEVVPLIRGPTPDTVVSGF